MRAVLYSEDMTPITVVKLDAFLVDLARNQRSFRLACEAIFDSSRWMSATEVEPFRIKAVDVNVEWFVRNGQRHFFLVTSNEEDALLLKSTFLSGQQRAVNKVYENGKHAGYVELFGRLAGD